MTDDVARVKTKYFNSNQLKLIALLAMTIDHVTSVIWSGYQNDWWLITLHLIGRLAAPLFWFMIVEGYVHTHNIKKYISRLFIFAVVSHFAYNFCFGIPFIPFQTTVFNQTSVMWPLAWGVVAMVITDSSLKQWQKTVLITIIAALTFCADWSSIAVLAIMQIYINRGNLKKQILGMMLYVLLYAVVYFIFIDKVYGMLQLGVICIYPLIKRYNGERGKWKGMKWFFYIYYPLHLVLLGLLRIFLHGNVGVIIGGR
jgi:hypothetical protein